ncbi:hypothetical protein H696_04204 [Fonticula alba]|uniref:Uncharacterized protein n=1 Tax=Fonticula alba TaxID=691883 RepID=A0A058Z3E3_FONAL|nr:hypothetical protein H696_04204 [Fonticula alba]KCV68785.1 hypothetical protein H696_04204 [Fonticula alba]|eukprot:XP_009496356.1 hypothetical protein H696_04204 [Fonticula alba]
MLPGTRDTPLGASHNNEPLFGLLAPGLVLSPATRRIRSLCAAGAAGAGPRRPPAVARLAPPGGMAAAAGVGPACTWTYTGAVAGSGLGGEIPTAGTGFHPHLRCLSGVSPQGQAPTHRRPGGGPVCGVSLR